MSIEVPVMSPATTDSEARMLSVPQICGLLAVSKSTVYALVDTGELPSYHIGTGRGAIRVSRNDLNAYLASRRKGGMSPEQTIPAPRRVKLETLRPRTSVKRQKKARAAAQ